MPREGERTSHVRLRLVGAFGVSRDGVALSAEQVGSRKSRTLLKLLAVERPGLVPVDRIVATLWDDAPPAGAEQNIATLVSRLRAVLGASAIIGGRRAYQLADGPLISVDIDEAAQLCDRAERQVAAAPAVALTAAERALALLSPGAALTDEPDASWADPARDEVRVLLRRGRLTAAQAALGTGDARPAMGCAELAMTADPLDEEAHRLFMTSAAAAGEVGKALAAYAALRERLSDELGARAVLAPLLMVAQRVPWIATHAAALAVDGQALIRLGAPEPARAALATALRLASRHGLPHVLHEANEALRTLS